MLGVRDQSNASFSAMRKRLQSSDCLNYDFSSLLSVTCVTLKVLRAIVLLLVTSQQWDMESKTRAEVLQIGLVGIKVVRCKGVKSFTLAMVMFEVNSYAMLTIQL